ncbi:MAG: ABC transporter ATP-binding protein [Bacilli bacterium]
MKELLRIEHVEKFYGTKKNVTAALNDINFKMMEGEFVGIMGPSGSGKTTLLNCLSTIDTVSTGHIYLEGTDLTTLKGKKLEQFRRDKLGFIFQDFNLLDTLTAFENIALALTIQNVKHSEIPERVNKVANKLGIGSILTKFPYEISGGQKQRVAAARALVTEPSLILADEPTGALDSKSATMLLESMENLNEKEGSSILMVTHDPFTASYAHRILFVKDGKIFSEIERQEKTRKQFFNEIINVISLLGGESSDVL